MEVNSIRAYKLSAIVSRILNKKEAFISIKCLKANNRNDDSARIRWINSDLIGFTNKMKNIKAETDTT